MLRTELLGLPIYNNPETDLFKIQDWNDANVSLEASYKDLTMFRNELPIVNTNAEIIDARGGEALLGNRINNIDLSLKSIKENIGELNLTGITEDLDQLNLKVEQNKTNIVENIMFSSTIPTSNLNNIWYETNISINSLIGDGLIVKNATISDEEIVDKSAIWFDL